MTTLKTLAMLGTVLLGTACGEEPTGLLQAPERPRSTALTVGIYGPSAVKPYSTCMWETAGATGGTPPYEYSWSSSQGDDGSGQTFTATAPGSLGMIISLTVTDANENQTRVRKNVSVLGAAQNCVAN